MQIKFPAQVEQQDMCRWIKRKAWACFSSTAGWTSHRTKNKTNTGQISLSGGATSREGDIFLSLHATWHGVDEWNKRAQAELVYLPWSRELCDRSFLGLQGVYRVEVTCLELRTCPHLWFNLGKMRVINHFSNSNQILSYTVYFFSHYWHNALLLPTTSGIGICHFPFTGHKLTTYTYYVYV